MADISSSASEIELVPGRSCGTCTMCCKLLDIDVLEKPRGLWCKHCNPKAGCTAYDTRPQACRGFYCGYLRLPDLDDRWKPAKAKFLINFEERSNRIAIHADADRADAWRIEPYYSTIKQWAANAARSGGTVIIWAGEKVTLVLPDREKDLGPVRDDQIILPIEIRTARGIERDFIVVEPNDPRVVK
jgi:hypothetical protein